MSEKPITSEKDEQSQAQGYLDYYWKEIGAPDDLVGISTYDKKIMHDVPLLLLQPLEVPENFETDRDKLVKFFVENNWLPQTKQEATIAGLNGIGKTMNRASRTKQGKPEAALKSVHRSVNAYWQDSQKDLKPFNDILTPSESFEFEPDVDLLRSNNDALYLLGDYLLSREFLEQGNWLNRSWRKEYKNRQKYWRGFMLAAAKDASDDVLRKLFNNSIIMARERSHYWTEKKEVVDKQLGHLALQGDINPAISEDSETEIPIAEPYEFEIPEKAQREIEEQVNPSQKKRIEILTEQEGSYHLAEKRVLGAQAPKTADEIEREEVREIVKNTSPPRGKQRPKPNPALKPGIRRLPGYDDQDDPSNPWHF